jgi:CRP-like cAMP-binding protein
LCHSAWGPNADRRTNSLNCPRKEGSTSEADSHLARWIDYSPGEVILEKGQPVSDAIVLISGEMEAILSSKSRMALRPGQLIGDAGAYSGLASPVDVVACSRGTLAKWDLRHLTEFTANRPALRAKLSNIVSADLAAKLRDVAAAVSRLGGETVAPRLP